VLLLRASVPGPLMAPPFSVRGTLPMLRVRPMPMLIVPPVALVSVAPLTAWLRLRSAPVTLMVPLLL